MVAEKIDRSKYRKRFGSYLRSKREKKFPDLSGAKFAASINITGPYLSNIERGKVDPPSKEVVKRLAKKLNEDEYKLLRMAGYLNPISAPIFTELPDEAMHGFMLIDEGMSLIDDEVNLYDLLGFVVGLAAKAEPKTLGDIFRFIGDLIDSIETPENVDKHFYSIVEEGKAILQKSSSINDLIPSSLLPHEEESEE